MLMKTVKGLLKGKKAQGVFEYMNNIQTLLKAKFSATSFEKLLDLNVLEEALQVRAAYNISETFKKLASSSADDQEKINSIFAMEVLGMTKAHFMYLTYKTFKDFLNTYKFKCPKVKENLTYLAMVYALTELQKDSTANYECGYFK